MLAFVGLGYGVLLLPRLVAPTGDPRVRLVARSERGAQTRDRKERENVRIRAESFYLRRLPSLAFFYRAP